jgi:hypothetical protein
MGERGSYRKNKKCRNMLTILWGSEEATYNQNMFTEKILHPY